MAKRSLKASSLGIARAKQAFQRREWTQEYLASAVGLQTRQPIWKFFSGRPIERHLFIDICFQLDLDWEDIADRPQYIDQPLTDEPILGSSSTSLETTIDWVQLVRSHVTEKLQLQYNTLQAVLDGRHSPALSQIYTDVYLLPYLSNQRWLEVEDLQPTESFSTQEATSLRIDHAIAALQPNHITIQDAIANHSRLMILGKPGSGKTTVLQHLALQGCEGTIQSNRIPIFITLRDWHSEHNCDLTLEEYLSQQWNPWGIALDQVQTLLQNGNGWLLLDGLDEVSPIRRDSLQRQIQKWADSYPLMPIIITCRLAAQDYHFRGFTYMEMADFSPTQISTFVHKWFAAAYSNAPEIGSNRAYQFLDQLQKRENQPIRELAVTPILLHLTCLVFQERGAFPKRRSRLYQHGLDILMVQWDAIRGVHRDSIYYQLSIPDRLNILSQLAATMFEQGRYFFEKNEILPIIFEYLAALPNCSTDPETLWVESESILQAIVLHHGLLVEQARDVYSFSHLTFQEYLTARKFFSTSLIKSAVHSSLYSFDLLASHVAEPHWQDVISMTLELLPNPERLLTLLERKTDAIIANDEVLQCILRWIQRKVEQVFTAHMSVAVRSFYLSLSLSQGLDLALAIDPSLTFNLHPELSLDLELSHLIDMGERLIHTPTLQEGFTLCFAFDLKQRFTLSLEFRQTLESLHDTLMEAIANQETLEQWCDTEGPRWLGRLRQSIMQHRDIGHEWQLDGAQQQRLRQYYRTTLFLVTCINQLPQTQAKQLPGREERLVSGGRF